MRKVMSALEVKAASGGGGRVRSSDSNWSSAMDVLV